MKEVLGVTLVAGRDDELLYTVNNPPEGQTKSGRLKELAIKGLAWEEALKEQKEGAHV